MRRKIKYIVLLVIYIGLSVFFAVKIHNINRVIPTASSGCNPSEICDGLCRGAVITDKNPTCESEGETSGMSESTLKEIFYGITAVTVLLLVGFYSLDKRHIRNKKAATSSE